MNKPLEISLDEWREIMEIPLIQERWNIEDLTPQEFADCIYGVKFDYADMEHSIFKGDLYILLGDDIMAPAIRVMRMDGGLVAHALKAKL